MNEINKAEKSFQRVDDNSYQVNSTCVFSDNNILKNRQVYELHQFHDESVSIKYIKLMLIYYREQHLSIIGVDIASGDIIKCSQKLDEQQWKFLIADTLYFMDNIEEKVIKAYFNKAS